LARVGPVNRHAAAIMDLITSPRTAVHIVTVLEEMPVQEAADTVAALEKAKIPVGAVVVNQIRRPHLGVRDLAAARRGRLDRIAVVTGLRVAGLAVSDALVDQLLTEAKAHADRVALEKHERAAVKVLDRPTYELPRIADGIDLAALYELGAELSAQGAA
jgi:anion-transporting  ArsA/GET3 family ATPase